MDADFVKYITSTCKDLMSREEMIALLLLHAENDEVKNAARFQYTGSDENDEAIALRERVIALETIHGENLKEHIAKRIHEDYKEAVENFCPKCGLLARTRFAKQCPHCFHSWHDVQRILVVLDLDETLIHATDNPPDDKWDFEVFEYKVYKRPGLRVFLEKLRTHFDVAVWSSASDDYVEEIVFEIFPYEDKLEFVWGRSKCTPRIDYDSVEDLGYFDQNNHLCYSKPLKKLKRKTKRSLDHMLIIDDSPEKTKENYGNAIYPREFNGEQDDNELAQLWKYLMLIKDEPNIRKIEKRGWHNKV